MSAAINLEKLIHFTESEVLKILNISQATLWRYRNKDINPFPKPLWIGRNVYLESEIVPWLLANRRG